MTDRLAELRRPALGSLAAIGVTALLVFVLLPNQGEGHGVPAAIAFQGLITGLTASVLAAGLVLLFRTSRIINFGALAFGAPGGLLAFHMIRFTGAPFALAVVFCLVLSGAFGAVAELTFGRRFAKRSRLIFTIATIFISQTLVGIVTPAVVNAPFLPKAETRPAALLAGENGLKAHLPLHGFEFTVGSFPIKFGFAQLFTIEMVVVTLIALALVMRYSRLGVALRSVAENNERAAMLGISTGGVTTAAWTIAGVLGGVAVLLTGFSGGVGVATSATTSGEALLLPLTAAVLGRFRSLWVTFLTCVLLGVMTNALTFAFTDGPTFVSAAQLVLLVGGLLLQRRDLFRLAAGGEGSWRLTAEERPVPREMAALAAVRGFRYVASALLVGFLLLVPFLFGAGTVSRAQSILLLGIIGLSLVLLTGWAGQVSLGQYAFVAVGAVVAGGGASRGGIPFLLAVPMGTAVAALVAVLVGLPALKVKGLFLGVATFGLAVATSVILFDDKLFGWLLPRAISRPEVFISFDDETNFYYLILAMFVLVLLFLRNLRSSRFGRVLIASRDNDAALQSGGVSIIKTRLQAFALSGAIAGFGGSLLAFQLRTVTSAGFKAEDSFQLFVYVVLGGVSSILGAMIGVAYLGIQTYFVGTGQIRGYIIGSAPILLLYFFPGGLLSILVNLRDAVLRIIAQRRGMVVPALFRGVDAASLASRLTPLAPPLSGAGLAALPRDARWSIGSRMHGKPGHAPGDGSSIDEEQLFAAAAAAIDADDESTATNPAQSTDLVGTTGAHS